MLGQTEIERIADEILSELQAGDRTEAGSRAGAQEAGQAACVYGTGAANNGFYDILPCIRCGYQAFHSPEFTGSRAGGSKTDMARPEAVKERIREHSPLL